MYAYGFFSSDLNNDVQQMILGKQDLVQIVQSSCGGALSFPPEWASEKSTRCWGRGTMPGSENTAL